jgi:hypothetical protein
MGRRSELLVLPPGAIEKRRALIGRQRLSKVLAGSSGLERIAEPLVLGQRAFEEEPSSSRIALPEAQQSCGAIDGRPQHGDRLADPFGFGQESAKAVSIL